MGKNLHDFSKSECPSEIVGTYENQAKVAMEKKIDDLQKELDELRTDFENNFL